MIWKAPSNLNEIIRRPDTRIKLRIWTRSGPAQASETEPIQARPSVYSGKPRDINRIQNRTEPAHSRRGEECVTGLGAILPLKLGPRTRGKIQGAPDDRALLLAHSERQEGHD